METLTVIIPAFNEAAGIQATLEELCRAAERWKFSILVVDDGSTDGTRDIVARFKTVRLVVHPYNKGYGSSLKTGVRAASTDYVAFYDADGQHRPEDLEALFANKGEYDLLIGARGRDSHQDFIRKPGKKILAWYARFLTGRKIPDLNSGLRLLRRSLILKLLPLMPNGFSFSTTSTIAFLNLGYSVGYHPIVVRKRIGRSTVRQVKHGSSLLLLILRLTVLFEPLKVFVPISALLVGTGIVYELAYGRVFSFHSAKLLPGALFLLLSGILIFFFGLVVDQLSELRKHPLGE